MAVGAHVVLALDVPPAEEAAPADQQQQQDQQERDHRPAPPRVAGLDGLLIGQDRAVRGREVPGGRAGVGCPVGAARGLSWPAAGRQGAARDRGPRDGDRAARPGGRRGGRHVAGRRQGAARDRAALAGAARGDRCSRHSADHRVRVDLGELMGAAGRAVGAQRRAAVGVRRRADHNGRPARRDRPGVGVHHVGHDAGDVVRAAAADGQLDQLHDRVVRVRDGLQRLVQGLVGDHVGQAVGAQQVAVAEPGLADRQVGVGLGPAVERAQQQRALRVAGGRLRGQPALVDQRLDQRVVPGDLEQLAVAQQVGAGVADVAQRHVAALPEHRGQRGAHALDRRVGHAHLVQRDVRLGDRLGQRVEQVAGGLVVQGGERGDGDRAGDLACRMPAHPVGDGEQAGARVGGVLVAFAEEADVGADRIAECKCHLRSSRTVLPIRIGTPDRYWRSAASPSGGPGTCHSSSRDPRLSTGRPAGTTGHAGWKRSHR